MPQARQKSSRCSMAVASGPTEGRSRSLYAHAIPLWQWHPAPCRENVRRPEIVGLGFGDARREVAPGLGARPPVACGIDRYLSLSDTDRQSHGEDGPRRRGGYHPPTDPPAGLVPIPLKGAVLLLTQAEYLAGIRWGKWWRRSQAMQRRGGMLTSTNTASAGEGPTLLARLRFGAGSERSAGDLRSEKTALTRCELKPERRSPDVKQNPPVAATLLGGAAAGSYRPPAACGSIQRSARRRTLTDARCHTDAPGNAPQRAAFWPRMR
jgi:hypothetical protein